MDWSTSTEVFTLLRLFLCLFAALTLAGGVIGFAKAGSKASLIAGSIFAALLLASAWLMGTPNSLVGSILGALSSLVLAARFIPSYRKSRKVMPAGMMAGLSIASLIAVSLGLVFELRAADPVSEPSSEPRLSTSDVFADAVKSAERVTTFEGLPRPSSEGELYKQERAKPVRELLGYPFYPGAIELKAEDVAEVRSHLAEPGNYDWFKEEKKCGGFHPDWAFEWTLGSDRYLALVCFGCSEIKLLGPTGESRHEFSKAAVRSLAKILQPYRKNRPLAE